MFGVLGLLPINRLKSLTNYLSFKSVSNKSTRDKSYLTKLFTFKESFYPPPSPLFVTTFFSIRRLKILLYLVTFSLKQFAYFILTLLK